MPETVPTSDLPLIRSHERMDYKRCPMKWYWAWRLGLVPRAQKFGALELGTWMHAAFQKWYAPGTVRNGSLTHHFKAVSEQAIDLARYPRVGNPAPEYVLEKAEELAALGEAMAAGYEEHYADDFVDVQHTEIPLEFRIGDPDTGELVAIHMLKPDMVYVDKFGDTWLMEHKTAAQIMLEHLPIDDQARPYLAMAERALLRAGALPRGQAIKGIMYNFLRKTLPDERPTDASGRALNKNGSISKQQPAPRFVRYPVTLLRAAKARTLRRLKSESVLITLVTKGLREGTIDPSALSKTPHRSCPKFCQYFTMCVNEENGANIRRMQRTMYVRRNPYEYDAESTDTPTSFEVG